MSLAPWRSILSGALHRNRSLPYARYAQLATVRADGRPANRTIVFRGFLDDTNQLQFITDSRSEKFGQIHKQPWGELCWYLPQTREQFRFLGQLALVDADPHSPLATARRSLWNSLSDSARLQFVWPDPGQPRADDANFEPAPPDSEAPPANFCLLLLDPERVDHLELRGNPQNRHLYWQRQTNWAIEEVNP